MRRSILTLAATAALVASACSSSSGTASPAASAVASSAPSAAATAAASESAAASASAAPSAAASYSIGDYGTIKPLKPAVDLSTVGGPGEGRLDLVAWEGYVESGQNSPDANWVQPFEQETGCTVHVTYKPTSDEMVTAMEGGGGGQYDGVSASGDASNRLIADGAVAPVNVKLLKNFKNIAPNLQSPPNNTVGGKHYGPSFMWGGNVLLYNTSKVTPKPDSWSIVFDKNTPYAGSLTAYDGPIYIADAALYLKATQPSLGIKDPYELTQKQFNAAVQLLKDQHPNVKKYWGLISDEIDTFASGEVVAGQSWPYQVVALKRDGKPADSVVPKEGMTGWSDTWMISSKAKHPNCMYKWMDYTLRPEVQASVATYVQYSPAVPDACSHDGAGDVRRAPRERQELLRQHQLLEDAARQLRRQAGQQVRRVQELVRRVDGDPRLTARPTIPRGTARR